MDKATEKYSGLIGCERNNRRGGGNISILPGCDAYTLYFYFMQKQQVDLSEFMDAYRLHVFRTCKLTRRM